MAIWCYAINWGDVFGLNNYLGFRGYGGYQIGLSNIENIIWVKFNNYTGSVMNTWTFYTYVIDFQDGTTSGTMWTNNIPALSFSYDGYYYANNVGNATFGQPANNSFAGFVYSFTLWYIPIYDFSAQYDACGIGLNSTCLWFCLMNYYINSTNKAALCDSSCTVGCSTWATCNQCSDLSCSNCTSFSSACISDGYQPCFSGYSLNQNNQCCLPGCANCTNASTYGCVLCYPGWSFLNNICISQCPPGYNTSTTSPSTCLLKTNPIINITLSSIQNIVTDSISGIAFSTGAVIEFYPYINSSGPIPAMNRGYYFNSASYMTSSTFVLPFNFTMVFFIKMFQYGIILQKTNLIITLSNNITIAYNSNSYSFAKTISSSWEVFTVYLYTNSTGSLMAGVSGVVSVQNMAVSAFQDSLSQLMFGDDTNSFVGFLWRFSLYTTIITSNSSYTITLCTSSITSNCLWDCDILSYFSSGSCNPCNSVCTTGCRIDSTCSVCTDPKCYNCSDYSSSCTNCYDHASIVSGLCQCNNDYYWNTSQLNCISCDPTCATCTGSNNLNCLSCYGNATFYSNTYCLCNDGYYWSGTKCAECYETCETCSTGDVTGCIICKSNSTKSADNSCSCGINQYWNGAVCSSCNPSCYNCSGPFDANCTSCPINSTLQTNHACTCNSSFYWNDSINTCIACDSTCLECNGSKENQCISCHDNAILGNDYTCNCNSNYIWNSTILQCTFVTNNCMSNFYYDTAISSCKACDATGASCSGPSNTNCVKCPDYATLISGGSCVCDATYYWTGTECFPCYSACWTCNGNTSNNCTLCWPPMTLVNSLCSCGSKQYWNGASCESCDISCAACTGSFSNNCTVCLDNANLQSDNTCTCNQNYFWANNQCLIQCSSSFYWNTTLAQCSACDISCVNCSGASNMNCTSCHSLASLQSDNTCLCISNSSLIGNQCTCSDGFYYNSTYSECKVCDIACKTCSGYSNTDCTSCPGNATLISGNDCSCNAGYYWTGTECSLCYSACWTCNGNTSNNCTLCWSPMTLVNNTCSCGSKKYWNGISCESCNISCAACIGSFSNNCTMCLDNASLQSDNTCTCDQNYFWANNQCAIQCSSSFYWNTSLAQCSACDISCLNCSGASNMNCTSCHSLASLQSDNTCLCISNSNLNGNQCTCNDGCYYNLTYSECKVCDIACKTCSGYSDTDCTSCPGNATLLSGNNCSCNTGYYWAGTECSLCYNTCKNCNGNASDNCTSCYSPMILVNNSCSCGENLYWNGSACESCDITCVDCVGSFNNNCTKCLPNASLQSNNTCICNENYTWNGSQCYECNNIYYPNSNCSICYPLSFLISNNSCLCSPGYYWTGVLCDLCNNTCLTCSGGNFNNCTSCKSTMTLLSDNSCYCGDKMYWNGSICSNCNPTCANCTGSSDTNCINCSSNATLQANNSCICNNGLNWISNQCAACPNNTYWNTSLSQCSACDNTCLNCSGFSSTNCTSCYSNATLQANSSCLCNSGYYWTGVLCALCNNTCLNCSGGSFLNCTSCPENSTLQVNNSCLCNNSFFWNWTNCIACNPSCLECNGTEFKNCISCMGYNNCTSCNAECLDCFGGLNNQCSSCPATFELQSNSTCACSSNSTLYNNICICKEGYYWNSTYSKCVSCDSTCVNCSSYSNCLNCTNNAYLNNSHCYCNSGWYWNASLLDCDLCDPNCIQCNGPSSDNCTCQNHSQKQNNQCICNSGYYNTSNNTCLLCDTSCLNCSGMNYYDCTSCNNSYLLEIICLSTCPIGYYKLNNTCILNNISGLVAQYNFNTPESIYLDNIQSLPAINGNKTNSYPDIDSSNAIPAYQRGLYFTGNGSYLSFPNISSNLMLFGIRFFISIWLNPYSFSNTLLSKDNLLFSSSIMNLNLITSIKIDNIQYSYKSSSSLNSQQWNHILINVDYNYSTIISFVINKVKDSNQYIIVPPFIDTVNSLLFIGSNLGLSDFFKGFVYSLDIFVVSPLLNDLVSINCDQCSVCPNTGICIVDCNITNYYNQTILGCSNCPAACVNGCRNNYNCNLCSDLFCRSCTSYNTSSCTDCINGYEIINYTCQSCNNISYYDNSLKKCTKCKGLCISCISQYNCTECKNNSSVNLQGNCQCNIGYYSDNDICVRNQFNVLITINSQNIVTLIFTETLANPLSKNDLQVFVNAMPQTFTIEMQDSSVFLISINYTVNINQGDLLIINFPKPLTSALNSIMEAQNISISLFSSPLTTITAEIAQVQSYTKVGMAAGLSAVAGASIINADPSSLFTFLNSVEIFTYVLIYQLNIDPTLSGLLQAMQTSSKIPNLFQYLISESSGVQLTDNLSNFGLNSNLILINAGQNLIILIGFNLILFACYTMKSIKNHWINAKIQNVIKSYKYRFYLRYWIQSYLLFTFTSIIGLMYSKLENITQIIDFGLCGIFIVIYYIDDTNKWSIFFNLSYK